MAGLTLIITPIYYDGKRQRIQQFYQTIANLAAVKGKFIWLVIDDNSPNFKEVNQAVLIAKKYISNIIFIRNKVNLSVGGCQNLAIEMLLNTKETPLKNKQKQLLNKVEFVKILHSDDLLTLNILSDAIDVFERDKNCLVVYGQMYRIDENNNIIQKIIPPKTMKQSYEKLKQMWSFPFQSVVFRKKGFELLIKKEGVIFDKISAEDNDLLARIFKILLTTNYHSVYLPKILAYYRTQTHSLSVNKKAFSKFKDCIHYRRKHASGFNFYLLMINSMLSNPLTPRALPYPLNGIMDKSRRIKWKYFPKGKDKLLKTISKLNDYSTDKLSFILKELNSND